MRLSAAIAGILALLGAVSLLAWATRPSPKPSETSTERVERVETPAAEDKPKEPPKENERHDVNPFTLRSEGPLPRVQIESTKYNFGRLAVGATGQHDFVIRNVGEADLRLAQGPHSCRCTIGTLGSEVVPPGGSATVHVEWHPPGESESFKQTATIWTDDPQQPKIDLEVEGAVVPLIVTVPQGVWTLGILSEKEPTVVKGKIVSLLEESFEVESVETSSESLTCTYRPLTEEELKESKGLSGYELTCSVSPGVPVGSYNEHIKLHLSLKEAPLVQLLVQGSRIGPFHIVAQGWAQEQHLLRMGRFPASAGKTVKASLFITAPEGQVVEIGPPVVTPPILNVSITRDESFSTANGRQRFLINVEAPPGLTPGRWRGDTAVKVVLPSNHPDVQTAIFHVELQAD